MRATGGQPRGHAGRASRVVGTRAQRARVGRHNEPGRPQAGVDLQAKTVAASERDERARARWRERVVGRLDPRRLVFVDECGANVGVVPLRARAPKGERAHGRRRRGTAPRT